MAETTVVSLPRRVLASLREEATHRGISVDELIAERKRTFARPGWLASGHDDPDLSLRIEELLQRSLGSR